MNNETELISALTSEKRSVQIQAIVKLTRVGRTKEAIEALKAILNAADREVSYFAAQAIEKIAQRTNIKTEPITQPQSGAEPTGENKALTRADFINAKKNTAPKLLKIIREAPETIAENVLPSVGAFLTKFGDMSDANFIAKQLAKADTNLVLPYINAAEAVAPSVLQRFLPMLLASKEPLVRSYAIRALRIIDPDEAERHFSDLLASRNPENRLAAIGISFHFPFERVKAYMLSMLPDEHDKDVLTAIRAILASNPDVDAALGMLDCIDASTDEQKPFLINILKAMCVSIASANLLPGKQPVQEAIIRLWKSQRLEAFLYDLEIQLPMADENRKQAIIAWIEKNRKHPKVQSFIERLGENPQTEQIFGRLTRKQTPALKIAMPSLSDMSGAAPQPPKETQPPKALSEDEAIAAEINKPITTSLDEEKTNQPPKPGPSQQPPTSINKTKPQKNTQSGGEANAPQNDESAKIKALRALEIEDYEKNKAKLYKLCESNSPALCAEALTTLLRLHPDANLLKLAKKTIKSKETQIKTAAFKILERLDATFLKSHITAFLTESNAKLRVRAVRFALKYKPKEAVNALSKLVADKDSTTRSNAVSCLALCPFNEVYSLLAGRLDKESHPLIAKQITDIFLSNPSKQALNKLDKIVKVSDPAVSMVISQARNDLAEILETMPEIQNQQPLPNEEAEKPYSVSNVRKLARQNKQAQSGYNENERNKNQQPHPFTDWRLILPLTVIIVFLAALPVMMLSKNNEPQKPKFKRSRFKKTERSKIVKSEIPDKLRMNQACSLTGVIESITSDKSFVLVYENSKILIKFEQTLDPNLKAGDTIRATVIPYNVNPHGIVLSRGRQILKVKQ